MSGQILANSGTCSQWRAKSFLKLHQKFHTAAISRDIFENFLIGYETELTQKHLVKVDGVSAQILMKPSQLFWWRTIASLKCYRIVFVLIPSKKVPKLSIIRIHKLSGSIFLWFFLWFGRKGVHLIMLATSVFLSFGSHCFSYYQKLHFFASRHCYLQLSCTVMFVAANTV